MLKYENNILFEDKPLIIAVSLRKISCSKTRVKIIIFIFSNAKMDILLEEERVNTISYFMIYSIKVLQKFVLMEKLKN